jgi:hypothetical protein
VLELVGVVDGPVPGRRTAPTGLTVSRLEAADPPLDAQARDAYRRRLAELEEDLEEARSWADPEWAARAEAEIDALIGELARAAGRLGPHGALLLLRPSRRGAPHLVALRRRVTTVPPPVTPEGRAAKGGPMTQTQEAMSRAEAVYLLEGTLLEACSCNVLCPCWIGEDPDLGECDRASPEQRDALVKVFTGQLGGPMADFAS